jgi:putative drug exporter of the RND superfamily
MLALVRYCTAHRRRVILAWVAAAIAITAIARAVGPSYANNFSLRGTEAQRASDLLSQRFRSQAGDLDTVVWRTRSGSATDAASRAAIAPVLARLAGEPHVTAVVAPFGPGGARQVSADGRTAFATINYDKRANQLPKTVGTRLLAAVRSVHAPGLQVAAGGAVAQQAERSGPGQATTVGVIAALVILLLTFGSLLAAGMPLITAGLGLVTGVGLIGLMTHAVSTTDIAPQLALMIGLGVGIDYALFIVTRFRQAYAAHADVEAAVLEAMDTSGRAIVLAGTTVIIALLGMFAIGVPFLNGMAIAASLGVLTTLLASLTVLPALLSRFGERVARGSRLARRRTEHVRGEGSGWQRWAKLIQRHPWPAAVASIALLVAFALPLTSMRLDNSDASNNPPTQTTRQAYDMLAAGFGKGFNGPLQLAIALPDRAHAADLPALAAALRRTPDVAAVVPPRVSSDGTTAVIRVYPQSAPQDAATTDLVNHLRHDLIPHVEHATGARVLVGGFTAGSIDFSNVIAGKLPVFIAVVVALSALLLMVIFRSLVIPVQAAFMNLLSIGGALGVVTAIFHWGWLGGALGVQKGPVDPWVPVLMFAIVFGLSMDYEVFLISRVHEEWVRTRDASRAVRDGLTFTGRVITAAAAIMICVFVSFLLGDQRTIKEFGLGLAGAVFLDAVVVRCLMLPAVLELLGGWTWRIPRRLSRALPRVRIEGSAAGLPRDPDLGEAARPEPEPIA